MTKKKTSKKQDFSFDDMPKMRLKKNAKLKKWDPSKSFRDPIKVGLALLESLENNDPVAFIEILDAYLRINRTEVARKTKLARSTVQQALSGRGNPSLKTLAKIVHEAMAA